MTRRPVAALSRFVNIAFPMPPGGVYTYRLPEEESVPPPCGRVVVPLRGRRRIGYVSERPVGGRIENCQDVIEIIDREDPLPDELIRFLDAAAAYYMTPPADFLRLAYPSRPLLGPKSRLAITEAGQRELDEADPLLPLTGGGRSGNKRLAMLDALSKRSLGLTTLRRKIGIDKGTVERLIAEGVVVLEEAQAAKLPPGRDPLPAGAALQMNSEQASALEVLFESLHEPRKPVLLHGVTASGKTEVYIRLLQEAIRDGGSAIFLAPEIALSQALHRSIRASVGVEVVIFHSGQSALERQRLFEQVRSGAVRIVVGPRSALFAPVRDLRLIIVDEEHDGSYKSGTRPRYHARDMAVLRATRAGALVVLGSATPSIESYYCSETGKYDRLELPNRALRTPLPEVEVVDMRQEFLAVGHPVLISAALRDALKEAFSRGEQGILLLNRRGYAGRLVCRACGYKMSCRRCSANMVYHRSRKRLLCHLCGESRSLPGSCPECSGELLELRGAGTERVAAEVERLFPEAEPLRVDGDRSRAAVTRAFRRFGEGRSRLLVGTQMVAKGHDFADVSVVGVLSADASLALPDFRGAERTFAMLTQVAGRAGRRRRRGRVILQCYGSDHYALRCALDHDYRTFFQREVEMRRVMRMPPSCYLALVTSSHRRDGEAARLLDVAARRLRIGGDVDALGPAPAFRSLVSGRYRYQLLVRGRRRTALRSALQPLVLSRFSLEGEVPGGRLDLDLDPIDLL